MVKGEYAIALDFTDVLKVPYSLQKEYRTFSIYQNFLLSTLPIAKAVKMSHFSTVKTKLTSRECLVQALQDLNLAPQVHEKAQPLQGYYGGSQGQSAEIIVSGRTIKARADIGFKWNQSSEVYEVIHDSYETVPRLGQDFFSNKLMLAYGQRMVRAKAVELQERFGDCAIAEETNGTVRTLRLTFSGHQQQQQYTRR